MQNHQDHRPGRWLTPLLAGAVLGAALQVQQAALWPQGVYAACAALGAGLLVSRRTRRRGAIVLLAATLLAFAAAGGRAHRLLAQALDPALEGRDLVVTGVAAAMPQTGEAGIRFRFDVEAAQAQGQPVRIPPHLSLVKRAAAFGTNLRRLWHH